MPAVSQNTSTTAVRRVDADSPWLGLLPFTEETQRFFFGRDAEIREVFLRVRDHTLTVLYGQSGLGKTSLIGAGLIPKLRADTFRPVLLRLRFEENDLPALEQVGAALAAACGSETESAETLLARWRNATLWECFHHPALRADHLSAAPPVLIIDQFEEIFTLGAAQRPRAEIEALGAELADLVENRLPASLQTRLSDDLDLAGELDYSRSPLRLIITLREDFLCHLEAWKGAMPALMRNRMALRSLRGPQALEAVVRPGRLEGHNLVSDEVGAQIVRVIARQPPGIPLEEIEAVPPLLSLLCDELNRARDGAPEITAELVEKRHGDILHEFYGRCFEGFPPAVRRFVEDRLVTIGGHRNQAAREDAEADLARSGVPSPGEVLNTLLARRLLSAEERSGTQRIEITHDVLAPLVTESRDKRQERERAEQAEAERQIAQENAKRIAREKRRLLFFAVVSGIAAVLAIAGMIFGFYEFEKAKKALELEKEAMRAQQARRRVEDLYRQMGEAYRQTREANMKSAALLSEAAQSDRVVAEQKLVSRDGPAAFAYLARAIGYEPSSIVSAEKAVAALNDWRFPIPVAILQGHTEQITSAQFSPESGRIVTASLDNTARIWDAQTGKLLAVLQGHTGAVASAEFSPNGKRIVTAYLDNSARIWDAQSGKLLAVLQGHTGALSSAQFSPDGQRIVTASLDNTARIWDAQSGKLLAVLQGHTGALSSAQFNPDGQRIVTASLDNTARIWDAQSGKLLAVLQGHTGALSSAQFSPDGQRIVTASLDKTARIWNAQKGELLASLQGHTGAVTSAEFSPDGQRIVTASDDKTARVWESQSGKPLATLRGHEDKINSARFSPGGQHIVTASLDKTARIWDAQNGNLLATLQGHDGQVSDAKFSPDGQRIVTAGFYDDTARVWNTQGYKLLIMLEGDEFSMQHARFSPDGQRIVTCADSVRIWEAQSGKPVVTLLGHGLYDAQFSQDGQRIVTSSRDNTAQIWDAQTGNILATLKGHEGPVYTAVFSPDGRHIVTASYDKTARIWDARNGKLLVTLSGHEDRVDSALFSPDGQRIVTASEDKTARLWDAQSGRLLAILPHYGDVAADLKQRFRRWMPDISWNSGEMEWTADVPDTLLQIPVGAVLDARFSPDSKRIVTASYKNPAQIWDAESGKALATLGGHLDTVNSAQFSPDSRRIVTASNDKTAGIWDAQSAKLLATLRGHAEDVTGAQFSPDGQLIVTASLDNTARLWNAQSGNLVATLLGHEGMVNDAQFSPDGRRIVTASLDKTARIWSILPPGAGSPPDWFRDFLILLAQHRLNRDSELEVISLWNLSRSATTCSESPTTPRRRIRLISASSVISCMID